uniref:Uncharacterized protein n=1 Tax=Echinococcus granulosus TaxID=6210 RepID=A0A068X0Y4_ECHGR|nr:hypothetical protein EgrG_002000200 [Echinococcus granulosus]
MHTRVPKVVLLDRLAVQMDCLEKAHRKRSRRTFVLDFGTGSTTFAFRNLLYPNVHR